MVNGQEERKEAIERVGDSIVVGSIGLCLTGVTYALLGSCFIGVLATILAWCLVVGLQIFLKMVHPLRNKIVSYLDKKWENWWKYF